MLGTAIVGGDYVEFVLGFLFLVQLDKRSNPAGVGVDRKDVDDITRIRSETVADFAVATLVFIVSNNWTEINKFLHTRKAKK